MSADPACRARLDAVSENAAPTCAGNSSQLSGLPGPTSLDDPSADILSIAVVGAGPRGIGWLERFAENRAVLGGGPVTVHLIDPFPPGPGKIWRYEQSPLLKLNSLAEDVTVFTDEKSVIDGPIVNGPSLAEWVEEVRKGRIRDVIIPDLTLARELETLTGKSFPSRRLQSLYLDWFYRYTLGRLDDGVTVLVHRDTVVAVDDLPTHGSAASQDGDVGSPAWGSGGTSDGTDGSQGGRQHLRLAHGEEFDADIVVYSLGHSASATEPEQAALESFATRKGLFYLPPSFTADASLGGIAADEPLIVRGFGLAAVDLLVLLGEGRGGRYERAANGQLQYFPSGNEPHIFIGSRRGVPYHSKVTSDLVGENVEPRFFTPEIAQQLLVDHPHLDFREHVWPEIAKELLHGYYAELFTGHPERTRIGWDQFLERFAGLDPFGDPLRGLLTEALVDPGDRLDFERFDRPLTGYRVAGLVPLQEKLRDYIRDDLTRRNTPEHSAAQGLFLSLLQAIGALTPIADSPNWTAVSYERDLNGWWKPFFSYVASGPPGHRLEEILALSQAGVVTFLGGGLEIIADEEAGVFRARGANSSAEVTARALVDAWLPPSGVGTSYNPALRSLLESGAGVEYVHRDGDDTARSGRLLVEAPIARLRRADGHPHPRRFAIGPYTSVPTVGAFARPRTNALSFRENDAVAREVIRVLAGLAPVEVSGELELCPAAA